MSGRTPSFGVLARLGKRGGAMVGVERGQGWARISIAGDAPVVGASLPELVRAHGLEGRTAAAVLEGSEVVVRRLTVPPMRSADLRAALALECRNLAGDVADPVMRHEVLGPSKQAPGLDVLVAVAPRRVVEDACRAIESAGLVPRRLTIRAVALRALLRSIETLDREEAVAYLDLGLRESHISVLRGDEIRFTRECGVGVATFVDALRSIVVPGQGVRLLEVNEAEALLLERGVQGDGRDAASGIPASAVLVMLRPSLERLVRELWNSIDYVHEQFHGQTVARIALLGETARVPGLASHLAGVLKMPVQTVDPGRSEADAVLARGGVAGLGLDDRSSLDFLEPSDQGLVARMAEAVPAKAAIVAAAALLLSVSLPAEVTVQTERARVAGLERRLEEVAPHAGAVELFREARRGEEQSAVVMGALRGGTPSWSEVLRDLSHRVGSEARLTSLAPVAPGPEGADAVPAPDTAPDGLEIGIEGLVRRDRLRPEGPLGELMASLERSPYVDQVVLETCQAASVSQSRFVIRAKLQAGGVP